MSKQGIDALLPALVGGLLAIALALVIRTATGTKLLAELVLDASSFGLQPRGFSFLLGVFGPAAKPLLFLSVLLGKLAFYVIVWRLITTRLWPQWSTTRFIGAATLVSTGALVLFSVLLVLLTPADLGSRTTWPAYAGVTLFTTGVYALIAGAYTALAVAPEYESLQAPEASRRAVMLRLPALMLGAIASVVIVRRLIDTTGGGSQRSHFGRETPEVTPVEEFYIVSKNLLDPGIDADRWELRVHGSVTQVVELKYDDVKALPVVREYATLQCISNEVGGDLMGNALWTGVPLRNVVNLAGPKSDVTHVIFRCEDDYIESLPLARAMLPEVLLTYEMNGERLTEKHGFPVRLLAPGKYGMRNPKWITEIILASADRPGYWVERGWSSETEMNTSSRIDIPSPGDVLTPSVLRVHGVAFSGKRGIAKVEVSTDGGSTWDEARVKPPLSPFSWVLWHYDWQVPSAGDTQVSVLARATDGAGDLQTATETPAYPDGATGYPRVPVFLKPQQS
jgi:DMSO/TMAO reductase YedYZ molybdopterin-dependent catalytic subunit